MSVVPEKKSMGWYAPAAVAVFGLGLYIARKKKIQLIFTDDSNAYREVKRPSHLRDAALRASTNLDISNISEDDLDRLKSWWTQIGKNVEGKEPTTLPQNILRNFLDLKQKNPQDPIDKLLQEMTKQFESD